MGFGGGSSSQGPARPVCPALPGSAPAPARPCSRGPVSKVVRGGRAYPDILWATTPDGGSHPICVQGKSGGLRGLTIEGDAPAGQVRIWSEFKVQEVDHF
jgi:hypothetical protein